jgi:hypothetical protein
LVVFLSPFLLYLWIWHLFVLSSCNSIQVKFNHANICLCTHPCVCVGLECEVTAIIFWRYLFEEDAELQSVHK